MSTIAPRNFTHLVIPAEIWLRRDLSIQCKALWAEIRSLHDKNAGGCYASDEYLMEFMGLKRSRLHEIYKELKDKNLLEIVSFDGRRTIRRAIVPETEYIESPDTSNPPSGQQPSGKPDTSNPENRIDGVPPHNTYRKEKNKDSNTKEKRENFGQHVKLLKEEYEKLCLDHGEQFILDLIEQINDYCSYKGKSYKDYAATARQWIRNREQNSITKPAIDRRTLDRHGNPIKTKAEDLF